MPTVDGYVGSLYIPLNPEGKYSPVLDPTVVGLADYLAYWIRYGLSTKLEDPNNDVTDPLPEANVFPYDPRDNWVRNSTPALYIWWFGESKLVKRTLVKDARQRTLRLFYVACEVATPKGARVYSGLPAAVDAIMFKACATGYHPHYGYNGDPIGTPIATSLRLLGWEYEKGKEDFAQAVPNISQVPGGPGGGHVIRGYPVLFGHVNVWEEVEGIGIDETTDQPQDIPFGANINDPADVNGPLRIVDRYLISPSEADDNGE